MHEKIYKDFVGHKDRRMVADEQKLYKKVDELNFYL